MKIVRPTNKSRSIAPRFHEFAPLGPSGFTRVSYAEWGTANAERTVVCVHGLTRNCRDFDFLAQRLVEAGMRVVAPDLPGRGRSEWASDPQDYYTPMYLAVMSALIARLDVAEVDWVGTSLGGHIGMELAAQRGAPIRRLVLNDFGARVAAKALNRISAYMHSGADRRYRTIAEVEQYFRDIHAPFGPLTDAQWRHMAEHSAVDAGGGQLRLHHDPAIAKRFWWPILLDISLWDVWDRVECPVLIIHGEESDLLPASTVRDMQRRGRAASKGLVHAAEIPLCGHAPALMEKDQIDLIAEFLEAADADSAVDRTPAPRARVG